MKTIDTRGLSCPQPVVMTNNAIKNNERPFEILLDSEASRENVARILKKKKITFDTKEKDNYTIYKIK